MTKSDDKVPALRFKGFTDEWEQRKLGDIAKTYSGGTPSVTNKNFYNNGYIPFIKSGEIGSSKTEQKINNDGLNNSSAKLVKTGTLLYALYGATSGKAAISPINGAINQAVLAIIPQTNVNRFIYEWLNKNKPRITEKYLQGGQGNLSAKIIKQINIFTTSKNEELKISDILGIVEKIISLQQRKVNNYFQYKTQLINTIFENKNWQMIKLKDVLSVPKKELANVTTKSQIMTVKLNLGGIVDGANRDTLNPSATKYYIRHAGQFIFGKQNFFNGSMAIVPKAMDEKVTSQDVPALNINNEKINSKFLLYYLSRKNFYKHTERFATGTGSKRLHVDTLLNLKIRIPDISYQNQIVSTLTLLDKKLQLETAKLNKLKQLKQFLLQNMFI